MKKWCWMQSDGHENLSHNLLELKKSGFTGVILQGEPEIIEKASDIGKKIGLEIHYWFVTMNCRDTEIEKSNPEWFMINREGKSSLINPPYVDYYKWFCPNHPEVLPYLKKRMDKYLQMKNLSGIQLDYIRYPDAILPKKLQLKYNLEQDSVFPEFDFCYCPICRKKFKIERGIDPIELNQPEENEMWLEFRLKSINRIVSELVDYVNKANKLITAAVFPTPKMSTKMVLQRWNDWKIDAFFPMLYHNFYTGNINWIADCLDEIDQDNTSSIPVYAGLFLAALNKQELQKVYEVNEEKCSGFSLFDFASMKII
ncbi:MAG: family 10 glycosylhydrolase [Candidatus Cloacimonetes bacterium]|nr:family 10 glycosylhydrolase [Candidatus Cloacimonadota bacterium]